jgi:hypothetical protein
MDINLIVSVLDIVDVLSKLEKKEGEPNSVIIAKVLDHKDKFINVIDNIKA